MTTGDARHEVVTTRGGARAVRDRETGELMHPVVGPLVEAEQLYVAASKLEARLREPRAEALVLLDVGLGAGSNALAAWKVSERLPTSVRRLEIVSFDHTTAALELAASGIDCEVIDVRSLAPIDYATIGKSVAKTGRVVIVEEGPKTGGVSGEIAAGLMEHCGESLISPVVRVASADVPVPFTPVLENAYRPDPSRIVAAVRELVRS